LSSKWHLTKYRGRVGFTVGNGMKPGAYPDTAWGYISSKALGRIET
jgi:hypothetical protein